MGLGMFSNLRLPASRPDNKLVPAPPSQVNRNATVRDGVQEQQVKQGKAAPKIVVNQPKDNKSLLGG